MIDVETVPPSPAFAIVGPSGAGKDSVMAAVAAARPDVLLARRVVTRPADPTEPFEPRSRAGFAADRAAGRFVLDWDSHGLSYGVPIAARDAQLSGRVLLVNLSRAVLPQAALALAPLEVIHLDASAEVLAQRLTARGREDAGDIGKRLRGAAAPLPEVAGLAVHRIDNSGPLDHAVRAVLALLPPPSTDRA
ncbi:phosphonate metabolism protein/1,5-bisphosphokinase (PRPP-forming) PhnN [Paracoccus sp. Z118]|uniref:phosphonate metabolism protein/1,5-bisphosphokinase (PRPP-forming) PhnN n=1 Tax=Paracoccus sp. Z118 TaxID=2851017 RepID=UPI001C2BB864|nr:phosphonate metabolism protein/1,5-bisphosphokinase (PRPP-forming) PhnN [Paracoccus sp. Z118]MBV0891463.1 phosphonate metabolism protein/1,5-bisphosphokinase (PRPP-forming) PhnN [Paracoccus sp. Z118]